MPSYMEPPTVLFVAPSEEEVAPDSISVLNHMRQTLQNIHRRISVISITEEHLRNLYIHNFFSHIVRSLPLVSQVQDLHDQNVSHVIECTVEEYDRIGYQDTNAYLSREKYLSYARSKQNFFLGGDLHDDWKKVMVGGEPNVEYIPGNLLQDDSMFVKINTSKYIPKIVVDLNTKDANFQTMVSLVFNALSKVSGKFNFDICFITASPCPHRGDLESIIRAQYVQLQIRGHWELVELKSQGDVRDLSGYAIWLFLEQSKYTWVRFLPVRRGIPHIVVKGTEMYNLYRGLSDEMTKQHVASSQDDLVELVRSKLENMYEAYFYASELSEKFHNSEPALRSRRAFLEACIGSNLFTIKISWTSKEDAVRMEDLNPMFAKELQHLILLNKPTEDSVPETAFEKLRKFVLRCLQWCGDLVRVSEGSILLYSFISDEKALSVAIDRVRRGKAVLYTRNALVMIYRFKYKRTPPDHTVKLILYPPGCKTLSRKVLIQDEQTFEGEEDRLFGAVHLDQEHEVINMTHDENINLIGQEGNTPLTLALVSSRYPRPSVIKVVEYLLSAGADVNQQNMDGETPLTLTLKNDQLKVPAVVQITENLMKCDAKVNQLNALGETPLNLLLTHRMLYMKGMNQLLQRVLDANVNTNQTDQNRNNALLAVLTNWSLHYSCLHKIIRMLQDKGSSGEFVNLEGRSALQLTVIHPNLSAEETLQVMKNLQECGIKINNQDQDRNTAVLLVTQRADKSLTAKMQILRRLISQGASLSLRNKRGVSVLNGIVEQHWNNPEICHAVRTLLKAGANLVDQDENGDTPAMVLLKKYRSLRAQIFQRFDLYMNKPESDQIEQMTWEQQELLELLLPGESSIDLQNRDGESVLTLGCQLSNFLPRACFSRLLSTANVNLAKKNGDTALTIAVKCFNIDIEDYVIKELLLAGASQRIGIVQDGWPPLSLFLARALQQDKKAIRKRLDRKTSLTNVYKILCQMLSTGADVCGEHEVSPLIPALYLSAAILEKLVAFGISVECTIPLFTKQQRRWHSLTILHLACENKAETAMSFLLNHGAHMTTLDRQNMTPFEIIVHRRGSVASLLEFIWHGVPFLACESVERSLIRISLVHEECTKLAPIIYRGYRTKSDEKWINDALTKINVGQTGEGGVLLSSSQEPSSEFAVEQEEKFLKREHKHSQEPVESPFSKQQIKYLQLIKNQRDTLQSLQVISRWSIRESLVKAAGGRSIVRNAQALRLPQPLLSYILLEDIPCLMKRDANIVRALKDRDLFKMTDDSRNFEYLVSYFEKNILYEYL